MFNNTKHLLWMPILASSFVMMLSLLSGCNPSSEEETAQVVSVKEKEDRIADTDLFLIEDEEDKKRLWFPDLEKYNVLKEGQCKGGELIEVSLQADSKRTIGIDTNVFWNDDIQWTEGHTIRMNQTNAENIVGDISKDGNGFGREFEPVDGRIEIQVENKSDKTFQYAIYEEKTN